MWLSDHKQLCPLGVDELCIKLYNSNSSGESGPALTCVVFFFLLLNLNGEEDMVI